MTAPARRHPTTSPITRGLIGKVHVAKAQLALTEDSYRAILERITGKASSAACSVVELEAVLAEFQRLGWMPKKTAPKRAGTRPLADGEAVRKIRALWLACYHLGVVRDPAEAALAGFVQRVSGGKGKGVAALQWLRADGALKAIEALKAMAARPVAQGGGGVDWAAYDTPDGKVAHPRRRVVEAQGRILGLDKDVLQQIGQQVTGQPVWTFYGAADWDRLIDALGTRVRAQREG